RPRAWPDPGGSAGARRHDAGLHHRAPGLDGGGGEARHLDAPGGGRLPAAGRPAAGGAQLAHSQERHAGVPRDGAGGAGDGGERMSRRLGTSRPAVSLVLALVSAVPVAGQRQLPRLIGTEELERRLTEETGGGRRLPVVLDVRQPWTSYLQNHL